MLKIVVCDDDKHTLDLAVGMINDCIEKNDMKAQIVCMTTDYNEMFVFLHNTMDTYLFFLDIDFGDEKLNGLDIARIIKQEEPLSKIVFVTGHSDLSLKVLKSGVEPFGFIEKDFQSNTMAIGYKKYIDLALDTLPIESLENEDKRYVSLLVGIDEYIELDISQILYVESVKTISHFVCYHSVDGSRISVRDTIENVLETLGEDFMRSHRSVIINTRHVIGVTEGLVNFSNGESAACSYRMKKEVIKRCLQK